jgi:hypothetical protein
MEKSACELGRPLETLLESPIGRVPLAQRDMLGKGPHRRIPPLEIRWLNVDLGQLAAAIDNLDAASHGEIRVEPLLV